MATTLIVVDELTGKIPLEVVSFDVTKSENHSNLAVITEFPVESGANISDHIRTAPKVFSCEVFISNTPIKPAPFNPLDARARNGGTFGVVPLALPQQFNPLVLFRGAAIATVGAGTRTLIATTEGRLTPPIQNAQVLTFPVAFDAVANIQIKLASLIEDHARLLVVTSRCEYDNMYLTSVGMPVSLADGSGASFTLECRQVKKVTPGTVDAPKIPLEPQGAPKKSKGNQGAEIVQAEETAQQDTRSLALRLVEGTLQAF